METRPIESKFECSVRFPLPVNIEQFRFWSVKVELKPKKVT